MKPGYSYERGAASYDNKKGIKEGCVDLQMQELLLESSELVRHM